MWYRSCTQAVSNQTVCVRENLFKRLWWWWNWSVITVKKKCFFSLFFCMSTGNCVQTHLFCRCFSVRCQCEKPHGAHLVLGLLCVQMKTCFPFNQMPWPELNPLSVKHGVICRAWPLCVFSERPFTLTQTWSKVMTQTEPPPPPPKKRLVWSPTGSAN